MKVFFTTHSWLPVKYEGANVYHHELAKLMLSWGWEVEVCSQVAKEQHIFDGVSINPFKDHPRLLKWCDIAVSRIAEMNRCKGKPTFVIKHSMNNEPLNSFAGKAVIFCAEHVRKLGEYGAARSFVWRPMNRYEGTVLKGREDGYVTLINCNQNKGGEKLIQLAKMMPHIIFLGVLGGYDTQRIDRSIPNIIYMKSDGNMEEYYSQTSILLILSHREGCPTVAQEAMSFGIPVISFHLDGVKEVCGDNAIYCSNIYEVMKAIDSRPQPVTPPIIERDYEGLKQFFKV